MNFLAQVAEFHRVFLIPDAQEPTFDPVVMELRYRLMREEAEEYYDSETPAEALDSLCDALYVILGSVLQLGLKNSYSAHYETRYPAPARVREDLLSLCERFKLYRNPELTLADMQHELEALVKEDGFEGIFEEAFARVQKANMGKQWTEEEVMSFLPASVRIVATDLFEHGEFKAMRQSSGQWVVWKSGKVFKPASFQPPVFDDLLQTVTV